jgi:1-acyl-sn-glycerol-3-phosphate acyltransferase
MPSLPLSTRLFNEMGRRAAQLYVRRLMLSDIRWPTDVPSGPKIVAANHPTTSDPFFLMAWPYGPIHILITESAFKVPVVGHFLRLAGHVPVYADRGREAYYTALSLLAGGHTIGVFPEGSLSEDDGQILSARSGAVRMAATEKVPIIPAGIALDWHFVRRRQLELGVTEKMRWFWLGAYEVSAGEPLILDHGPDDRDAVRRSTNLLKREIEGLVRQSAQRLLDKSWPLQERAPGTSDLAT